LITSQRAIPYTKIKDLLYNMNWDLEDNKTAVPKLNLDDYTEPEKSILSALQSEQEGLQIDQLAWKTQVPLNKLASILLTLEFAGIVKVLPGNRYKLV
jgi:DNA processing protein